MASSSTTDTLSQCGRLPDELLLRVLKRVMGWSAVKIWRGAVRGVSRRWRALHDGACTWLSVANGATDEMMHALCGRLPALTHLELFGELDGGRTACGGWPDCADLPQPRQLLEHNRRGAVGAARPH